MIASAVAIPEQPPLSPPTEPAASPSRKRRPSSQSSTTESPKRPRLDTVHTHGSASSISHASPPPSTTSAMSPPLRRHPLRAASNTEEKKRGQRLFGGLLSTLSQKSPAFTTKPTVHKRRDEIEQRQRDRLKRDDEERVEERRLKREELERVRRVEQKRWERESLGNKHAGMRARAGFLQTKAEPRESGLEEEIRTELAALEGEEGGVGEKQRDDGDDGGEREPTSDRPNGNRSPSHNGDSHTDQPMEVDDADQKQVDPNGDAPEHIESSETPTADLAAATTLDLEEARAKDDDHADDLVEGHDEDQVIY
ncbi:uncharacterized protein AB675_5248 [Cyphellophora attinorum]|uniref:Pinin/SDK/MemA protein domain-containing protein n=1 Tax=Cyphellophora attinorum TaxID=1664694 RepID=A0A0N1HA68_9EURO|nr:uncharacterized protein AB675_5248 [Phialophora attinorum]KPI39390.1 hypothetical protein AB675_5248 [Phialophora attinorum]